MREIKFRAWHPTQGMSSTPILQRSDYTGQVRCDGYGREGNLIRLELMQYTGLKDKNGREIYEGDIVQSQNFLPSVVKYSDSQGCFLFEDLIVAEGECYRTHEEWEIIGNIYETPELAE